MEIQGTLSCQNNVDKRNKAEGHTSNFKYYSNARVWRQSGTTIRKDIQINGIEWGVHLWPIDFQQGLNLIFQQYNSTRKEESFQKVVL